MMKYVNRVTLKELYEDLNVVFDFSEVYVEVKGNYYDLYYMEQKFWDYVVQFVSATPFIRGTGETGKYEYAKEHKFEEGIPERYQKMDISSVKSYDINCKLVIRLVDPSGFMTTEEFEEAKKEARKDE